MFGARLTGAGFGGACVALCRQGKAAEIGARVLARYNSATDVSTEPRNGQLLIPPPDAMPMLHVEASTR